MNDLLKLPEPHLTDAWDYITHDGITTLTVIPTSLPDRTGVIVRIKAIGQFFDADAKIPSHDMPAMIDALTGNQPWTYDTPEDVGVEMIPAARGGMWLTVSVDLDDDQPQILVPESQRLPLASALRRALDAAQA